MHKYRIHLVSLLILKIFFKTAYSLRDVVSAGSKVQNTILMAFVTACDFNTMELYDVGWALRAPIPSWASTPPPPTGIPCSSPCSTCRCYSPCSREEDLKKFWGAVNLLGHFWGHALSWAVRPGRTWGGRSGNYGRMGGMFWLDWCVPRKG